ncbi:MAG: hypothetical protein ACUVSM_07650 [Armatimonadota bacterium]
MSSREEKPGVPPIRTAGRSMACIGCLAALLLCVLAVLLFLAVSSRDGSLSRLYRSWMQVETCRRNLVELGAALQRYHNRHRAYPEKLEMLYPDFLKTDSVLRCPANEDGKKPAGYRYFRPTDATPPDAAVIRCDLHAPAGQQKVVLILRMDGRVEVQNERPARTSPPRQDPPAKK